MSRNLQIALNTAVVGITVFAITASIALLTPPEPAPKNAPLAEFSAHRAAQHLQRIARRPHSIGTKEHQRVREYIVSEAQKLGLTTEIQSTTVLNRLGGLRSAVVHNVIAVLEGKGSERAVAVVGHYDSQPHTPGAADNGAAVAAMLEAARALKSAPTLENDIVFLFTDAEEVGLLGAKAFVDKHPLVDRLGVVLNLEARGNAGTSLTFEVSPENGWAMREYAKAVDHPFAASVMYEVYRLLPNNTDFTIFRRAGIAGFNAAFVEGLANYHNWTDSPQNLDLGSLQHHGATIVGFARHFGDLSLDRTKAADVAFFNPIGSWLVLVPDWLNLLVAVGVMVLYATLVAVGLRRRRLTAAGIIGGFFLFLTSIAAVVGVSWLLQLATQSLYPHYSRYYGGSYYNAHWYFASFAAVAAAVFSAIYGFFLPRTRLANLAAGVLTSGVPVAAFTFIFIRTASYVITYPMLFGLIAWIACFLFDLSHRHRPLGFALVQLCAALPIVALLAPMIKMLFVVFGLRLSPIGAGASVFLLGYLLAQLQTLIHIHRWALPLVALFGGLIFYAVGHFSSGYDENQPLQSSVMYCLDADAQKAYWVSRHLDTDEWNEQFFIRPRRATPKTLFPHSDRVRLINEAPLADLSLPEMAILSDEVKDGLRRLRLNLSSRRGATMVDLYVHKGGNMSKMAINATPIDDEGFYDPNGVDYGILRIYGLPARGVELEVVCEESGQIEMTVLEKKLGLPDFRHLEPLPPHVVPDTDYESFLSLIKITFASDRVAPSDPASRCDSTNRP